MLDFKAESLRFLLSKEEFGTEVQDLSFSAGLYCDSIDQIIFHSCSGQRGWCHAVPLAFSIF